MESVDTLIVGAGISGLATAVALQRDYLIVEADTEIGGYCKTTKRDGFVWDYSGHFFHFRHPHIGAYFRERMGDQRVVEVVKRSFIQGPNYRIDFPFQRNIHQLPQPEFLRCLHDLYFAEHGEAPSGDSDISSFKDMLYRRYGRGIAEMFLIPYNEKLYACDLGTLDPQAMGRFFPHARMADVMRNTQRADNRSYNSTFTYPEGGAIEYVHALARDLRPGRLRLQTALRKLDVRRKIAETSAGPIRYKQLVSSIPFNQLLEAAGIDSPAGTWSWNKVVVFNLGFDRKGEADVHWIYFPDPQTSFYRVGFYDNILDSDRLSLYVELGFPQGAQVEPKPLLEQVLGDLKATGIVSDQRLCAWQCLTMDPAYVHITGRSQQVHAELAAELASQGVHSIGRYGSWTYCSIEDNVVQAWALADALNV